MRKYIRLGFLYVASDFTSDTTNRLTSLGPVFLLPEGNKRRAFQVFECSCGTVTITQVKKVNSGHTKSCGCLQSEITTKRSTKHGEATRKYKSPEYVVFQGMIQRCTDSNCPKYKNYGGRGITICDRWREPSGQGFLNFLADMGRRPPECTSIDRKNNDGDYCPENCRWATSEEQGNNTRKNRYLESNGVRQTLAQWGRQLGCNPQVIASRISRGWSVHEAVTIPLGVSRRK